MFPLLALIVLLAQPIAAQSNNAQPPAPTAASQDEDQDHPDLRLMHAEVPFYPPLARVARVWGTVELTVKVRHGAVTAVEVKTGPPMLAQAATENVKSWKFPEWVNATFQTKFIYELRDREQLPNGLKIEMEPPFLTTIATVPPAPDAR
jgi:outer membrane biosynthesis protein TonB